LRAHKHLELFAIDDEVVGTQLADIALKVVPSLLQEDGIFVSNGLLRRYLGQHDAWPALNQTVLEKIELVEAALDLELAG